MRLGCHGGQVKGAPGKLHAKLVDELGIDHGNECAGNRLVAIKVILEGGRKIEAIVQWRLIEQASVIAEVTHEKGFIVTEAMVQAEKTIVGIVGAENTPKIWLRSKSVDCFDLIDGVYVCEHCRIVKGRLAAPLYLIVPVDERLVLGDGPANCRAELVLPQDARPASL